MKSILVCVLLFVTSTHSFAEGVSRRCKTVSSSIKYLKNDPICVLDLRCKVTESGIQLNIYYVDDKAWCRAQNNGESCPSAQSCIDDDSITRSDIPRLRDQPASASSKGSDYNPCDREINETGWPKGKKDSSGGTQ